MFQITGETITVLKMHLLHGNNTTLYSLNRTHLLIQIEDLLVLNRNQIYLLNNMNHNFRNKLKI